MSRLSTVTPAHPNRRQLRAALVAAATALVLLASGLFAGSAPAHAATGQVRGHVFLDFDGDGVFDTGNSAASGIANDTLFAGVTVRAYDKRNALAGQATTTATGNPNFSISLSGVADGDPLRLEYTLPGTMYDSFAGVSSGTSVRFVTAGAENVAFGVVRPGLFNSNNPYIATVLQRPGIPTSSVNNTQPAVVINRWSVANNAVAGQVESPNCSTNQNCANFNDRKTVATLGQIGSVYSIAHDAQGRDLYVAASYKRGAGLGSLGLGGIYRINNVIDAAGAAVAGTPTVTPWVNVAAAGLGINVGTALGNSARVLTASDGIFADPHGFANAGKIGIGGMVIDSDLRILYFVNLNDKRIYAISIAEQPTLLGSWATPAAAGQRPFALSMHNGALYVGYNDTGEAYPFCPASSPGSNYGPGHAGSCTGNTATPMRAYVAQAPVDSAGNLGAFTNVLTASLAYAKGNDIYDWQSAGGDVANANPQTLRWNTWTDSWSGLNDSTNRAPTDRSVAFQTDGGWGMNWLQVYPQPFVASLSFDAAGFMTLGLGDRTQIQSGNRQVAANNTNPQGSSTTFETVSSGDMLLAALNTNGTYSLENNGTASGSAAGSRSGAPGRETAPTNAEGPGGYEFYNDRGALGQQVNHRESTLGATVIVPGVAEVASSMIDPLGPVRVNGLGWFNSGNGNMMRGFQQENDPGGNVISSSFQKGGGIGSLTLVLRDAPVEIGNRVWYDADLDGLQDADEPAINGAPVELWTADANGIPVAKLGETVTATLNGAAGTWYFRSEDAPSGGTAGFVKNASYVVVFPARTGTDPVQLVWPTSTVPPGFTGMTWAQLQRTTASASGSTALNDSNPDPTTGRVPITVGGGSENDHTIDAGWYGLSNYRIQKTVVGVAADEQTFTIDVDGATNFRGDNTLAPAVGAPPASDATVDTRSYDVPADDTVTSTERVPFGTVLTFREAGAPSASVAFTPQQPGNDDIGRIVVAPTAAGSETLVTATNSLTAIALTKRLSPSATLPADTTFPIEYTVDGGATQTATVAADATLTLAGIPWGAEVRIREPLDGPFSWGGYAWGTGTWAQGATALTPDADGWVTVSAPSSIDPLELTLTNHPYVPPALPFTGGLASDLFTILGALVIVAAVGLGVMAFARRRVRRVPAHRF
jgi:hypothetical protein